MIHIRYHARNQGRLSFFYIIGLNASCTRTEAMNLCTISWNIAVVQFSVRKIIVRANRFICAQNYLRIFSNIHCNIYVITAKPKAHAFKNEMCFPLTKTKCELKKHPNSKFECFFNDFNRTKTSLFLPFPSKLIQDNLVCVLELQE